MRRLTLVAVLAAVLTACTGSGDDDGAVTTAPPTTVGTQEITTPAVQHGTVSVDVSDLVGFSGSQLAGVLLNRRSPPDGIAGSAVTVNSDPFSDVQVLGHVDEEWGEAPGLWPWAFGVAEVPAGDYTLRLAIGTDFCCYSRWMPAETPDLRICDLRVTTTGEDQVIRITGIPLRGTCGSS
jgi:hypothetical protein